VQQFDPSLLKQLYIPPEKSSGENNGQLTIIGGSRLFHGAPVMAIKAASRMVGMVFFTSPEESLRDVAAHIKASVSAFIWVPWNEVEKYIEKSDAVLIGNGFMRFASEDNIPPDGEVVGDGHVTREITKHLLLKYPHKKWLIDAGSLQVLEPEWIPENAIITPNHQEYAMLFGEMETAEAAKKCNCIIVRKGQKAEVHSPTQSMQIDGGNAGMIKGGTGDVLAGVIAGLLAKNDPFLAAVAGVYLSKKAGESLFDKAGYWYSAEDLAEHIQR
jgi:NAD(P)H-hydrate epimerase